MAQSLSTVAGWRGEPLLSSDGHDLGKVRYVAYDGLTDQPVWLGVGKAIVTLLVPSESASPGAGTLRCRYSKDEVENQPPSDFGQGFANSTEERHLYDYFGLVMEHEPDWRVLLEGDDLPGLEVVRG